MFLFKEEEGKLNYTKHINISIMESNSNPIAPIDSNPIIHTDSNPIASIDSNPIIHTDSELFTLLNTNRSMDDLLNVFQQKYHLYIRHNISSDLVLIKYDRKKSKMGESLVRECRGVILTKEKRVICFPPEKSITLEKMKAIVGDDIDNVRFEEHVDGTMINVFYNPIKQRWEKSTRSRIGANCSWLCKETFATLFKEASNDLDLNVLDKDLSYTFVLVHPKNRIVVKYTTPFISLVTVRKIHQHGYENRSLEEVSESLRRKGIFVKIPKVYRFSTMDEMCEYVSHQDSRSQGIIVKYKFYRSKMRNKEYEFLKKLKGNSPHLMELYLRLRKDMKVKPFLRHFGEYKKKFNEFREEIHQITYRIYNWYVNVYINKYSERDEIPYEFKPHCANIHKIYIDGIINSRRIRITLNKVITYVNALPIYTIIFIRNKYVERVNNSINVGGDGDGNRLNSY